MTHSENKLPPPVAFDVNLLPYRDEQRHAQRRQAVMSLALAGAIACVAVAGTYFVIGQSVDKVTRLNGILSKEISDMDGRISEIHTLEDEVRALNERQKAISALQVERGWAPWLLDHLGTMVPPNVYLTALAQNGQLVTLTGVAASNSDISALLAAMNQSPSVHDAQLVESRTLAGAEGAASRRTTFGFSITFTPASSALPPPASGPVPPGTATPPADRSAAAELS